MHRDPLDDADAGVDRMDAHSAATGYYLNTYSAASVSGSKLTVNNVQAKRLALLVTKSPTAGTIQIGGTARCSGGCPDRLHDGQEVLIQLPSPSVRTGRVTTRRLLGQAGRDRALGVAAV